MRVFKSLLLMLCFVSFSPVIFSQSTLKPNLSPKAELKLKLPEGTGTNGSAVAWNPIQKKYYCALAGNEDYPIEVFDEKGVHKQTAIAMADIRGLWFNPESGFVEANLFEYHDIILYQLDSTGLISDVFDSEELYELPVYEPQAVLTLNTESNEILWYDATSGSIAFLDGIGGFESRVLEVKLPVGDTAMNIYAVGYTGVTGYEYAMLNFKDKKVYLISDATGQVAATITLPEKAIASDRFCFSYANKRVWLYDIAKRLWIAYKIF